jgi:pimeloyl-ACP methyl ester carboxylesterase
MRRPGSTRPFRGRRGEIVNGSVAEVSYRRLGGLDQWVMVRGQSVTNPILITLHGGPGFSDAAFFRCCNAALEERFTVVYWDQRGTGKSFDPPIPLSSMTVERFIADLDELVELERKRLGRSKVTILGHSWGSALGVLYAARFPEKVEAYVGVAQIGDWFATESLAYAYGVEKATRLGKTRVLRRLRAIGPPPYGAASVFGERTCVQRLDGQLGPRGLWRMGKLIFGAPESSVFELPRAMRAFRFSMDAMWPEVSRLNLIEAVPALQMPVFFFLGREDHWVLPETSVAYFEALRGPSKQLAWFEKSGHEPFWDEPAKFNAAMVELVLPVAGGPPVASAAE